MSKFYLTPRERSKISVPDLANHILNVLQYNFASNQRGEWQSYHPGQLTAILEFEILDRKNLLATDNDFEERFYDAVNDLRLSSYIRDDPIQGGSEYVVLTKGRSADVSSSVESDNVSVSNAKHIGVISLPLATDGAEISRQTFEPNTKQIGSPVTNSGETSMATPGNVALIPPRKTQLRRELPLFLISLVMVGSFEFAVYRLPIVYIRDHANSYGMQICLCIMVVSALYWLCGHFGDKDRKKAAWTAIVSALLGTSPSYWRTTAENGRHGRNSTPSTTKTLLTESAR